MSLFSAKQPPDDDGTIHSAIESLRVADKGTLALTAEGLVDLSGQDGPGAGAADNALDADEVEIEQAMRAMHAQATSLETPPAYNTTTSSAWRILEEQRGHALDLVREYDVEIARLTAKRDDAQRAADGCLAGQKAMESV